ncbi:MAG: sigma-E factor negative regulatory protein [Proteobacteria bacterium]|nr:sigma-E factor negative regulatory protein [Pseudomonadota bacterium]
MQTNQETLSIAMDDELGSSTASVLGRVANNNNDTDTWARYHLIGDVLRDQLTELAPPNFAAKLSTQIAQEPTILAPKIRVRSWIRPVAGLAVAASVAAIVVAGVQQKFSLPDATPTTVDTSSVEFAAPKLVAIEPAGDKSELSPAENLTPAPHAPRRLNGYLVKFNEQRSSVGVPGVNPYVRIVGFETE